MDKNRVLTYRKAFSKSILTVLPLLFVYLLVACEDVNSIHQKYYDRGEVIYMGVVDSLKSYSGYEKVRFNWEINADPRITKTFIYWNQRKDSLIVDVNRTQSGILPMTYLMDRFAEGNYIFEFVTKDDEGHYSMPKEIVVLVFGESYIKSLSNRSVASMKKQADGSLLITWDDITSNYIKYTTVEYKLNGETKSVRIENNEYKTILEDLKVGDKISIITTYLPEGALETLDSPKREYILE